MEAIWVSLRDWTKKAHYRRETYLSAYSP